MRLLLINSEYPPIGGGAGNASANIARILAQKGHDVTLLTSRFADLPCLEHEKGVTIYRIPALRRRVDRSSALEQFSFVLSGIVGAARLIPRNRPDVILAFFGVPSGAIAWLMKALYKIPYVVSLRGGDVPGFRPYDFRLYHKLIGPFLHVIWWQAAAVVSNSEGLRTLARAFDPRIPIDVVPNGVDLDSFSPPDRKWEPPRLLSVGRVVYQKGFDLGLQALAGLKDLPWEWWIAGDGPQMITLQTMVETLGLRGRIHFLGWQSAEALKKQYSRTNLFLFPSRHEGMPNAVLEAMASGLPVIATRIAGSEELVAQGQTGLLVPAESVDSLREALRRLLVDAQLRKKMGQAARQRVEQHFSWTYVAGQYEQILGRAVN